jgi:PAS domain S-box-containing protein
MGEILWVYDVQKNQYVEMGAGIQQVTGHPASAFLERAGLWMELVDPKDLPMHEKLLREDDPPSGPQELEYGITDAGGERHYIRERTRRITSPSGGVWVVGVLRDNTEQHTSQHELNLLREVVQQLEEAILVTDTDFRTPGGPHVIYANRAFHEMTGYSPNEIMGRSPKILQGPKTDREVLKRLRQCLEDEVDFVGDVINYRKDGSEYHVHWSITPVFGEDGNIKYYASIQRNVSEEVRLRQHEQRTQRLESLGNMVGGVAHDLNNILSPILMSAGLMETAEKIEDRRYLAKSLTESTQRAAEIVRKLLAFARGGGSKRKVMTVETVLESVYKMAIETFPRELDIQLQVSKDLWVSECSDTEMEQVFLNLALNAKDSMEGMDTGTIRLSAENTVVSAADLVRLNLDMKTGPAVKLEVSDTGTGIPTAILDKIFDPFFTTKVHGKGTGLGLASSVGIVHAHGGAFEVDSTPGTGTRFVVYLPAFPDRKPEVEQPTLHFEGGKGERILVVDDEVMITELVCNMLKQYGYQTTGVTSSTEALKLVRQSEMVYDVVITDVMMPEMDGVALTERIRELYPDMPVMIMSGYVHHDKLDRLKAMGLNHILPKPVRLEKLLQVLNKLLGVT